MKRVIAVNIATILLLVGYLVFGFIAHGDMLSKQDKSKEYNTIDQLDSMDQLKNYARIKIGSLISSYNGCKSGWELSMVVSLLSSMLLMFNLIIMIKHQRRNATS